MVLLATQRHFDTPLSPQPVQRTACTSQIILLFLCSIYSLFGNDLFAHHPCSHSIRLAFCTFRPRIGFFWGFSSAIIGKSFSLLYIYKRSKRSHCFKEISFDVTYHSILNIKRCVEVREKVKQWRPDLV